MPRRDPQVQGSESLPAEYVAIGKPGTDEWHVWLAPWRRVVTPTALAYMDAVVLAERLNREAEAVAHG